MKDLDTNWSKFQKHIYSIASGSKKIVNQSDLLQFQLCMTQQISRYCIVRPGGLGVGEPTGVINVIDGKAGSIQRADVAAFLLGAVTDKGFPYLIKTPCISSVGGTGWVKEKKAGFDKPGTMGL